MPDALMLVASPSRIRQFVQLCKPRVVALVVFTALIGMFLAAPGMVPLPILIGGGLGIALVAGAGAAVNCLVEYKIDAVMARTCMRPLPRGLLTRTETLLFASGIGALGLLLLDQAVNPLTMWLTLATFAGYAVIYTVLLKPATPQNIVIGGASGAMPPILGWSAVTGGISAHALLLFLIIFAWTPPHFWTLALSRRDEYAKARVPMLPVTHGVSFTRLCVLLYTVVLTAVSLLPFAVGMSGWFYLSVALTLDAVFLGYAIRLYRQYSDALSRAAFRYSIVYLSTLFAALLIDHHLSSVA
ncbi:MAG: heme o synthase [Betaproteobacteria bacterium]|nr:heme o synthase [Betaproteobacteria bacterium]